MYGVLKEAEIIYDDKESNVCLWGVGRITVKMRELSLLMKMFHILIVVMVTQENTFIITPQIFTYAYSLCISLYENFISTKRELIFLKFSSVLNV